jgi:hypothetical protein
MVDFSKDMSPVSFRGTSAGAPRGYDVSSDARMLRSQELFGGYAPDGTIIKRWELITNDKGGTEYGLMKGISEYRNEFKADVQKALSSTLNTYSAGTLPVLIPVYVDPEIVDTTRRATPLVELLPRVTNYGNYASFNKITTISTAQAIAEDAALTEQNDTYSRVTIPVRILASVGRVTEFMVEAARPYLSSGGYIDALSLDVRAKTLALRRLEEAMILLGDNATGTTWTEPVNSTTIPCTYSYDGLYQLITNANSNGFGGSSSYRTDNAGAALSIDIIRTGIRTARTAGGEPNLMVCDYATYDKIKSLIQDQLRYVSTQTIAWGITTLSFEGIPIIASRFLSTTDGTGSSTPYTGKSLFILDTNIIEMRVLRDVTYEELAQTNLSKKFVLSVFETLVVKAPQFNHVIFDFT